MRQDLNHREVFAAPGSVGEDFALILAAFADAFRGLASDFTSECHCEKPHYAGWR